MKIPQELSRSLKVNFGMYNLAVTYSVAHFWRFASQVPTVFHEKDSQISTQGGSDLYGRLAVQNIWSLTDAYWKKILFATFHFPR